ncbi:unannotated protein [freshwater metagenome]|uniref:Unannotated protein n=1 Tax=freshwater metagenome TaxID=449393 RepID=A0A6J6TJQ7_9ZZZZ
MHPGLAIPLVASAHPLAQTELGVRLLHELTAVVGMSAHWSYLSLHGIDSAIRRSAHLDQIESFAQSNPSAQQGVWLNYQVAAAGIAPRAGVGPGGEVHSVREADGQAHVGWSERRHSRMTSLLPAELPSRVQVHYWDQVESQRQTDSEEVR